MSLKEYSRKRNFEETSEPKGKLGAGREPHRFVIQKHEASHLHYDLRLELAGTLKSWAVPKGMPFEKGEKRLAIQVEDHPIAYIDFEGTIPKGQYGGGTVMVWDYGTFKPLSTSPMKELANGKLHFVLAGKKLHGEWYLVRLRDAKHWLMIKAQDSLRGISKKQDDTSALSGKSMAELSQNGLTWNSERATRTRDNPPKRARPAKKSKTRAVRFIEPMKARLVESAAGNDWIYEVKFDGFRALALKDGGNVSLMSRNEQDLGAKFPEILDAVAKIPADDAILDGEIVALDSKGRSSFQLLQGFEMGTEQPPIFFYAFDLLELNGKDFRHEPLTVRKEALEKLLRKKGGVIRFSTSLVGPVKELLAKAAKLGLEGLVGKRKDSIYEAGRRSGAWIKLKLHHEQEMVIGGYTNPEGARPYFGALLLGYYEGRSLRLAGKVGTGFNEKLLAELHACFKKIGRRQCPFENLPETKGSRYSPGLTVREMAKCHWLRPELICQVKFSEWTRDGKLRQPVFLGLREDKNAREVIRERAT